MKIDHSTEPTKEETDTEPQENSSEEESERESEEEEDESEERFTFPVDLEAVTSDMKRNRQPPQGSRKKAEQCRHVHGRRYIRGARHNGCGIAVAKQQRKIKRYEGLLKSWMNDLALHEVAAAGSSSSRPDDVLAFRSHDSNGTADSTEHGSDNAVSGNSN